MTDPGTGGSGGEGGVTISNDAASLIHLDSSAAPSAARPPEGTYTYLAASGSGDYVTGVVVAPYTIITVIIAYVGPDCFDQTFTFRTFYTETMHFCIKGQDLAEESEHRDIELGDLVEVKTGETCFGEDGGAPGDVYFSTVAKPPYSWSHHLTGTTNDSAGGTSSFEADGVYTYLEDKTVPGLGAVAKHFYDSRTVTGVEHGEDTVDWFFSPVDGTLLRFKRTLDIDYPFLGGVHYHETLDMTLTARPGGDAGAH
jgi:hypothetical protein